VEAFPWDTAPTYLVRDNDGAYGQAFTRRVRAMGIRDRPKRRHSTIGYLSPVEFEMKAGLVWAVSTESGAGQFAAVQR
jgi:hypothetical protein